MLLDSVRFILEFGKIACHLRPKLLVPFRKGRSVLKQSSNCEKVCFILEICKSLKSRKITKDYLF